MICQGACAITRRHIAADDRNIGELHFDRFNHIEHALSVTMGRVNHHTIHASFNECGSALNVIATDTNTPANTQATLAILARKRMIFGFLNILDGNEANQLKRVVDHQHTFQAVLVNQRLSLIKTRALFDGNEAFPRCHDVLHRLIEICLETQVAAGDDTNNLLVFDHRQAREAVLSLQLDHFAYQHGGRNCQGVFDDTGLKPLHLRNLSRLSTNGEIFVNDPDTAFLRQRDRKARFGHCIHRSGNQREIECDLGAQTGGELHVARVNLGVSWDEQNVVERKRFGNKFHEPDPDKSSIILETAVERGRVYVFQFCGQGATTIAADAADTFSGEKGRGRFRRFSRSTAVSETIRGASKWAVMSKNRQIKRC